MSGKWLNTLGLYFDFGACFETSILRKAEVEKTGKKKICMCAFKNKQFKELLV